ncbi:DUF5132 domain-containing protein [Streptomyces sp. NPDC051183]|uniref:DUF5132 domain-containing protein n=1 Tax=unclassified Streptomyces TaxID=2593676 RepID=UPI00342FC554
MLPVTPFLAGVIVSPFAKRIVKPIVRGVVKTSVGLAMDVKQASLSVRDEVRHAAAEAAGGSRPVEIAKAPSAADRAVPAKVRSDPTKGR